MGDSSVRPLHYSFPLEEPLSSTSHNQPVHLTPKARAFFPLAISEQNVAFAKSSLAFGAGDQHVRHTQPKKGDEMKKFCSFDYRRKKICHILLILLPLILMLCSCVSTSQRNTKLAYQNLINENYDDAFNQNYEALHEDIKNKEAIKLFPEIFEKVQQYHINKINEAKEKDSWDSVAYEYDRLLKINEQANEILESVKVNYKSQLSNEKKENVISSAFTSLFSVPKEDIIKIAGVNVSDHNEKKIFAYQQARKKHYEKGQKVAKEKKYRDAFTEFDKALSFVSSTKESQELQNLKEKYWKMAQDVDAKKHYESGKKLIKEKKYRRASSEFESALSFVSGYKDAVKLKNKYEKMADVADATKHYEKGQKLAKEKKYRDASSEFGRAISYVYSFKDSQELKDKYEKMANEVDAGKHYESGKKLVKEKKYRRASSEFESALSFVSGYTDALELKDKYEKMADEVDAGKHYDKGISLMRQKKYTLAYDEFVKANEYVYAYKKVLELIDESKNKMPPSESEIIKAVERCLSGGVPVSWVGNLMGGGKASISSITIQRIGILNESQHYWPMIIRVQGSALLNDPFNKGKRVNFDKNGDFCLYRDDYGDWQASLKGGMFQ